MLLLIQGLKMYFVYIIPEHAQLCLVKFYFKRKISGSVKLQSSRWPNHKEFKKCVRSKF